MLLRHGDTVARVLYSPTPSSARAERVAVQLTVKPLGGLMMLGFLLVRQKTMEQVILEMEPFDIKQQTFFQMLRTFSAMNQLRSCERLN